MNKKTFVLIWTFIFLVPSLSWAREGFETHGGSAVVCRNEDGSLKSVKLLDSYEAKIRYGLNMFPEDISDEELFRLVDERLLDYPLLSQRINDYILHFIRVMLPIPDGHSLKKIEDINPIVMEDGCTIEQLAVYDETQAVLLYRESWFNMMSRRDQAALFLHEAIFAIARSDRRVKDSTSARHLTAMLISEWSQRNDDVYLPRQIDLVSVNLEGTYRYKSQFTPDVCVDSSPTEITVKFDRKDRTLNVQFRENRRCVDEKMTPTAPIKLRFDVMTSKWIPLLDELNGDWEFDFSIPVPSFSSKKYGEFQRLRM